MSHCKLARKIPTYTLDHNNGIEAEQIKASSVDYKMKLDMFKSIVQGKKSFERESKK